MTEAAKSLKPPEKLTVSEWSDKYRRLSPEASAEPGRWKTSKAEYQRGVMDAISDPRLHTVVFKKSAQVGASELVLNIAGYYIHQDPCPLLLLQPTQKMGMSFSKDRLTPMVRDSPVLRKCISALNDSSFNKGVKKGSTLLQKVFPGGSISIAGMNSPSELASRPCRVVLIDEVDRAPQSAGGEEFGEGDPVTLARKRSQSFWNKKSILVSTPTLEGRSRIDAEWQESDQRYFMVPCLHCNHEQRLVWANVQWPEDNPSKARYKCEGCAVLWSDVERWRSVSRGEWEITRPEVKGIGGFHISEIYSPWSKLGEMAAQFVIAKRNGRQQLQTWINTSLGECWSDSEGEGVEPEFLFNRREHYPHDDQAPAEVEVLVAGIDVQDDRIEYEVVGYGAEEQSWGIRYRVLVGNPGQSIIWDRLLTELQMEFEHVGHEANDGTPSYLPIRIAMIDSGGHFTEQVYQFSRKAGVSWVVPVKGSSESGKQIARYPRKPNKDNRTYLTLVGTDTAKELTYARFRLADVGHGYCHFPVSPDYDMMFFEQVTAEKRVARFRRGQEVFVWEAGDRRNEALDCRVYALAGLRVLIQHRGVRLGKPPKKHKSAEAEPSKYDEPKKQPVRMKKKQPKNWAGYEGNW